MKIVWAPRAQQRIEEICRFIATDQHAAAERMPERVLRAARTLGEHPHLGRRGRLRGTCELVISGPPYLLIYRVRSELLEVLTILDDRRLWPPSQ